MGRGHLIRDANFSDIPGIVSLLRDAYQKTHYARSGVASIDEKETKRLLVQAIQRHNGVNGGACFVQVSETDGQVRGLILGTMTRLYSIGNKLSATDLFWLASPDVFPADPAQLMRNMVAWAERAPACVEVKCGTTAIMQDPEAAGMILNRMGFEPYGRIWRSEIER